MLWQPVQIWKQSRNPMSDLPNFPPNTSPDRNENRDYRFARLFLPVICRSPKISHSLRPEHLPEFALFYCPEFEPNARSLPVMLKIHRANPSANILLSQIVRRVLEQNLRLRFQTTRRRSLTELLKAFLPKCQAPKSGTYPSDNPSKHCRKLKLCLCLLWRVSKFRALRLSH